MTQLNSLIFKEVSIYLAYKCKFKELLEYALLSKFTFKIIQNIITNNNDYLDIILPIKSLYNYVRYSNISNISNSGNRLIKIHEIEIIKSVQSKDDKSFILGNNFIIKEYFTIHCKNLKHIIWMDQFNIKTNGNPIPFDNSFNGFFKFNSLSICWTFHAPPISNQQEIDEYPNPINDSSNFKFSFQFLEFYNTSSTSSIGSSGSGIKKLKLSTSPNTLDYLRVNQLDNILNYCKKIQSIKIQNQSCQPSFIKKLLLNQHCDKTLLSLSFSFNDIQDYSNYDSELYLDEKEETCEPIYETISTRNKLKRLIIKDIQVDDFNKFIKLIVQSNENKTLVAFGVLIKPNTYEKDVNILTPLYQLPLLSILYCNTQDLDMFFQFINNHPNGNITHLKVVFELAYPSVIINKLIIHITDNPNTSLKLITLIDYHKNITKSLKDSIINQTINKSIKINYKID